MSSVSNQCVCRRFMRQCGLIFLRPPLSSGPMRACSFWSSQERPCLGDIAHCVFLSLSPQSSTPPLVRSLLRACGVRTPQHHLHQGRPAVRPLTEDTSGETLTVSTRWWVPFLFISPSAWVHTFRATVLLKSKLHLKMCQLKRCSLNPPSTPHVKHDTGFFFSSTDTARHVCVEKSSRHVLIKYKLINSLTLLASAQICAF